MRDQRGMTLTELVVVAAIASIVAATTVSFSLPWVARETMRSAVHDTHAALQLTKIEAASRNRPCRLVVDTSNLTLQVLDTVGTDPTDDDLMLHEQALPESVGFDRPDSGAVVTMSQIGSTSRYQVVVGPDGMVTLGTGDVHYTGGGRFGRVSVHAAGGVELAHWDGSEWLPGS